VEEIEETPKVVYNDDSIRSLDWKEHIRLRPGMYIGKLGDGSSVDDGIYVLVKEIMDNSIDEHMMGNGKSIEVKISDHKVEVRDFGRGIPLGKVIDCVSKINTGGKYDSGAFQKSVGLNGVGTKATNALSQYFKVQSYRDGSTKWAEFSKGELTSESNGIETSNSKSGTHVIFEPDNSIFKNYHFIPQYLDSLFWNYAYLNAGLTINNQYGEEYYSFVNGQNTTQGGTHLASFREALVKTCREFYKKEFDPSDIRASIVGAIAIRVQEPVFESQTKTKLGSTTISPDSNSMSIRSFIGDFIKTELDNFLHKNPSTADAILKRILQSERERKDIAGIKKLANERAKKANLHNKKLRDCRIHLSDEKSESKHDTILFITEGDSASGSITKSRDVQLQAVFSLRGKPLNSFGLTKKIVYENEEFNLLQHALDIEDSLDNLRYNKIVIATDADVDGMHIRLLILTFFLQFFPDLVRNGHIYILETPLFRVRNKKETIYCYNEEERRNAIEKLGPKPEITRFKGLGEISPDEFGNFIGENIKLEPVILAKDFTIQQLLNYYMGKNTPERQKFIIENLIIEKDLEEIMYS